MTNLRSAVWALAAIALTITRASAESRCYRFTANTGASEPLSLTLNIATLPTPTLSNTADAPNVTATYSLLNDPNNKMTLTVGNATYELSQGAVQADIVVSHVSNSTLTAGDSITILMNGTKVQKLVQIILNGPSGLLPNVVLPPALPPVPSYTAKTYFIVGETFGNPHGAAFFDYSVPVDALSNSSTAPSDASKLPSILGVSSASSFGRSPQISPGGWIEIYGTDLASDARSWASSDFDGSNAPTALDGTMVSVAGKAAFVDYISPVQVNVLVPSDVPSGSQPLVVTTAAGASAPSSIFVNATQPGILAPPSFVVAGLQFAVATFPDGSYALPTGFLPGSRPAKPGETIVLYGVGFGPVVPNEPAGQLVDQTNTLTTSLKVSIGGMPASALYYGLSPGFTGLY